MKDNKHVILCIDDDNDILNSMKIILEANEFIVEEAISAEDGLQKYKKTNPDLLIVDLMMEEVDSGINLVKKLQSLKNEAPILLLSSVGDALYSEVDYSSLGLAGVMQKPIRNTLLLDTIKNILE
jgi:FixJ family two-component response regulator